MTSRTVTLDDLKERPLEDVLREVLDRQEVLNVTVAEGRAIVIQPSTVLKPLPVLEGSLPKGWKDAAYD